MQAETQIPATDVSPVKIAGESPTIGLLARDLHRLFHQAFEERIRLFGLPATSCRYLAVIREWGGATPGALSSYFGVRTPTTLSSLRNLEDKRLIRRSDDANDRRKSIYRLTTKGEQLEAEVRAAFRDVERQALAPLSEEEITQFRSLVSQIRSSLHKLLGDDHRASGQS